MSSPVSSKLSVDKWVESQESPVKRETICECLCHSRKVSMILLDQSDKERASLQETISKLDHTIQILLKAICELKE